MAGFVHMISSSMFHADLNIFRNDEFYGTPIIEQLKQRVNCFNYMTDFSLHCISVVPRLTVLYQLWHGPMTRSIDPSRVPSSLTTHRLRSVCFW